jgi:hypothetical protein
MSEEEKPAVAPVEPLIPVRYPEGIHFSEDLLKEWVSIPGDQPIFIGPLTRDDLDHFLFSTAVMAQAMAHMRTALIHYSNGRTEAANNSLQNVLNASIDAEAHNRLLFKAIVESVLKARNASK